jgi:UDPglucose 6-dehydrogenase
MFDNSCFDFLQVSIFDSSELITKITPIFSVAKVRKAKKTFGSFKGLKIAILGLTFKPGTDDLREAPSIPNVRRLLVEGANIYAYDPVGIENFKKVFPKGVTYVSSPQEALKDADIAFI